MTRLVNWRLFAAVALAPGTHLEAQTPPAPSSADATEIGHGRVVVIERDVDSLPWPRVRLYRFIEATPEQSAAMLADYEHQRDYNADLKEARIARRQDSARTEVFFRYAANVPFVSDVTYTVLDRVSRDSTGAYVIEWKFLSGSKVRQIEGSARFSPWTNPITGRPGTLLTYDNLVVPDFPFSSLGFVRRRAIANMRMAIDAIAIETQRELADDKPRLERQVTALRSALNY